MKEPEHQLSLFDHQKYLESHHFDVEKTNPNFVHYLNAVGKCVGDPYSRFEAQQWINAQVSEFKRSHGLSDTDMLNEIDDWPGKLREFLKDAAETVRGSRLIRRSRKMGDKISQRIARIKNRDSKFLEGTMLQDDFQWLIEQVETQQDANEPKPLDEWHEEDGDCLWWFFPICEPPYCGSPLDLNFPDYVTHFTRFDLPSRI